MKVTLNWLKEYTEFLLSPEELSERLTMAGLEVDAIQKLGEGLDDVIVAQLSEVNQHPDADRLTVCQVNTGQETMQVVCGARNHKTGDLVALAQPGTILPGNFKIKKSKIRNQESNGMLCSVKELGLGDEADGIMILPQGLTLGQPLFEALGLKDAMLEIGLTPNRADCLSVVGVAREVSAMVSSKLKLPDPDIAETGSPAASKTSITIKDNELCPRYAARLIEGVRIGPSPQWLVRRLEAVGIRSINNVVDVTNFVMMELGQPLHAFDFDLLKEKKIIVRRAGDDSRFKTLDGQERTLLEEDLVICDGAGPIALAGIMGGLDSEVQNNTTNILLESAYFNPMTIRRTSKRLGLHTESSHRFERGTDVDMVPLALDRATSLIVKLSGGKIAPGQIDIYPKKIEKRVIKISQNRTNQVLGLDISLDEISSNLTAIALTCHNSGPDCLNVEIPNFRPDLEREIDLIEEVARLVGYDRIPCTMPVSSLSSQHLPHHLSLERRVRDQMIKFGFAESVNYSFTSKNILGKLALADNDPRQNCIQILNPITEEQSVMRTTLVSSLLETTSRNISYRNDDLALFELRPVFHVSENTELPLERLRLTAIMCGRREPLGWSQSHEKCDFYDMKGTVEQLLQVLRINDLRWDRTKSDVFYHPGKSCSVYHDNRLIGTLGELHPEIVYKFDLVEGATLCDLDVDVLFEIYKKNIEFKPLSRFPDVQRDSSFLIDQETTADDVFSTLKRFNAKYLENIELFDVYSGKGVPQGKKSYAVRVTYRALDRTLTDDWIQNQQSKLIALLEKELGAELR